MAKEQSARTYLIRGIIALGLMLVLGYSSFQMRHLIAGPVIDIEHPYNGETINEPLIELVGTARNVTAVTLNDRKVFIDEGGHLRESLLLASGYNIIRVSAEDRFGRSIKKVLEVFVVGAEPTLPALSPDNPS